MEEVLWMRFFPNGHDDAASQVLDAATSNPAFERFYVDHLKKILLVRGGQRYLSKGNYNLTRFAYLLKLFPDARFIVPVRDPRWHIASLMKQHRLFDAEERRDPRILKHMQRAGHFEFGLDRRVINVGDAQAAQEIATLWRDGHEVRGWARYWAMLYGFVRGSAGAGPAVRQASLIVRYEDLCDRAEATLSATFAHVGLELHPARPRRWRLAPQSARLLPAGLHARGRGDHRRGDRRGRGARWAIAELAAGRPGVGKISAVAVPHQSIMRRTIPRGPPVLRRRNAFWPTWSLHDSVLLYGCGGSGRVAGCLCCDNHHSRFRSASP